MSALFTIEAQLRLVGVALLLLALFHVPLPKLLGWPEGLANLTPQNRAVAHSHMFFIGVTCAMLGLPPLLLTDDLVSGGKLGLVVLITETVFWSLRWIEQFSVYGPKVWRGSPLYTAGFIGFTVFWTWIVGVFAMAAARAGGLFGG